VVGVKHGAEGSDDASAVDHGLGLFGMLLVYRVSGGICAPLVPLGQASIPIAAFRSLYAFR
jgi:hypothetical protein